MTQKFLFIGGPLDRQVHEVEPFPQITVSDPSDPSKTIGVYYQWTHREERRGFYEPEIGVFTLYVDSNFKGYLLESLIAHYRAS